MKSLEISDLRKLNNNKVVLNLFNLFDTQIAK